MLAPCDGNVSVTWIVVVPVPVMTPAPRCCDSIPVFVYLRFVFHGGIPIVTVGVEVTVPQVSVITDIGSRAEFRHSVRVSNRLKHQSFTVVY